MIQNTMHEITYAPPELSEPAMTRTFGTLMLASSELAIHNLISRHHHAIQQSSQRLSLAREVSGPLVVKTGNGRQLADVG